MTAHGDTDMSSQNPSDWSLWRPISAAEYQFVRPCSRYTVPINTVAHGYEGAPPYKWDTLCFIKQHEKRFQSNEARDAQKPWITSLSSASVFETTSCSVNHSRTFWRWSPCSWTTSPISSSSATARRSIPHAVEVKKTRGGTPLTHYCRCN